ncbi:methyl-accepting chemotaxis protein [Natronospora cellulosivora (SeqCode)]
MNIRWYNSFKTRLILQIFLLILIPMLIYGFISTRANYLNNQELAYEANQSLANNISENIQSTLDAINSNFFILKESGIAQVNNTNVNSMLGSMTKHNPNIIDIEIMNNQGQVLYQSSENIMTNIANKDMQKALNGTSVFSEPKLINNIPIIDYILPIINENSVETVIKTSLNLEIISKHLSNSIEDYSGTMYIVNDSANIIAHPDENLLRNFNDLSHLSIIQNLIAGESATEEYIYKNNIMLASYQPIENTPWGVVVEISAQEAYSGLIASIIGGASTLIVILGFGIIISYLTANRVIKPIINTINFANQIAEGNLSISNLKNKSKDEIGRLSVNLNKMKRDLQEMLADIIKSSDEVDSSSQALAEASTQLSKMSEQVGASIQGIASGSEEQSAQIEDINYSVRKLDKGIEEIDHMALDMTKQASSVTNNIENGNELVKDAVNKANNVKKDTRSIGDTIHSLGQMSEEVGGIVEIINNISNQTNLLALNAAIEAARAGESGRGFNVVAEEIRELAEESAKSTDKITNLISNIQKQVKSAVIKMNSTEKTVIESVDTIEATGGTFEKINKASEKLLKLSKILNIKTKDMSQDSHKVEKAMLEIAAVSEEAAANSEEVAASSEEQNAATQEIAASSENLKNISKRIKIYANKFNI